MCESDEAQELDPATDLSGFPAESETTIYELFAASQPDDPIRHLVIEHCSSCGSSEPHHLAYVRERGICVT